MRRSSRCGAARHAAEERVRTTRQHGAKGSRPRRHPRDLAAELRAGAAALRFHAEHHLGCSARHDRASTPRSGTGGRPATGDRVGGRARHTGDVRAHAPFAAGRGSRAAPRAPPRRGRAPSASRRSREEHFPSPEWSVAGSPRNASRIIAGRASHGTSDPASRRERRPAIPCALAAGIHGRGSCAARNCAGERGPGARGAVGIRWAVGARRQVFDDRAPSPARYSAKSRTTTCGATGVRREDLARERGRERDARHARAVRRLDADRRVLEGDAAPGRDAQALRREQEDVGMRLAVRDVVGARDRCERPLDPELAQRLVDVLARRRGRDGAGAAARERGEKAGEPRQRREPRLELAVERLLRPRRRSAPRRRARARTGSGCRGCACVEAAARARASRQPGAEERVNARWNAMLS